MNEITPEVMQSDRKRGNALLVFALLAAILIFGGYLRFMSQNWDDFASLHPDERFLTRNLLPLVGGTPEFTPDIEHYPSQVLLTHINNVTLQTSFDVKTDVSLRVGGVNGTLGYDFALWWLNDADRRVRFNSLEEGIQSLVAEDIGALIVSETQAQALTNAGRGTRLVETFNSQAVQRAVCNYRYPTSNGAGSYFDTTCSALNPHNANVGFFAYGTLPVFMSHWLSGVVKQLEANQILGFDFQGETLIWRFLSATFDVGTIFLIFLAGRRLHNSWVGLIAAALYAATPFAIQLAHFGTVNAITHFFVMLAIWSAIKVQDKARFRYFMLFGIALGASMAGRINIVPLAGVIVLAAMVNAAPIIDTRLAWEERERLFWRNVFGVGIATLASLLAFRVFNPYAFQGPTFFHMIPNSRWLADIASARTGVSGASDIPPNWQWLGRTAYLFPLKDMLLWGMGLAFGSMAWFGVIWSAYRLVLGRVFAVRNILPLAWIVVYFAWIGRVWVMVMRYYLPLYGALALMAGWVLYELVRLGREDDVPVTRWLLTALGAAFLTIPAFAVGSGVSLTPTLITSGALAIGLLTSAFVPGFRQRGYVLAVFTIGFTLIWGLMFTNIYRHQTTRIQASRWVWENVPGDFAIRIDDAPQGTPLINIDIGNSSSDSATKSEDLIAFATRYVPGAPRFKTFTAPASGTITTIYAPHLADPIDNQDRETLYVSIAQDVDGVPQLLAEATLSANLSRENHPLGDAYELILETPVNITEGEQYTFKVEALDRQIASSGAVMLTEGTWDDRITTTMVCQLPQGITYADDPHPGLVNYDNCNGQLSYYALLQSFDLPMSYPVDESIKVDAIIDGLSVGDYLAITSNRFYDTETRNPARWPFTTAYYDLLFDEQLGYELVQTFRESFEFGPFSVDDQYLPIYDSPSWLNELEADEAFHVYDHPVVFVFRKSDDYDQNRVETLLRSIPVQRVEQISPLGGELGEQLAGVLYWSSLEADPARTALMQPADVRESNTGGGTWSERFDSDSLLNRVQVLGVMVWWFAVVIIGWVTWPILFTAFPRLGDKGFGFAKLVGLLLMSWLAWVGSSLKVPLWSQMGLLLILFALAILSAYLTRRNRDEMLAYLSDHRYRLVAIEVLAFFLFLAFVLIRLANPDLWHHPMGGEKPMDFAYFNAVLRTTTFPAYDPWYAGGYINYYYFGFVLVGVPSLLLKIIPAFAYNLIIPTMFSLTGIGAFSVAFNIVDSWRSRYIEETSDAKLSFVRRMGNPWVGGIAALLMCVVLGNLDIPRVLINEGIARLGGYERPQGLEHFLIERYTVENGLPPDVEMLADLQQRAAEGHLTDEIAYEVDNSVDLVTSFFAGLGPTLRGQVLPIGSNRWYWGPTRILAETPGVGGNAINEMPFFTFLYGDLHAHMINLSLMLFALLFIFYEVAYADRDERSMLAMALALFLGALSVGVMQATNTWDWPTFMLLSLAGLGFAWWRRWQPSIPVLRSGNGDYVVLSRSDTILRTFTHLFTRRSLTHFVLSIGGFIVIVLAVARPYTAWYASNYNSIRLWDGGKTPLWAYFDIHGLFLFIIVCLLIWETGRWLHSTQVRSLSGQRDLLLVGVGVVILTFVSALSAALVDYQVALIVLPLVLWIIFLFFRPGQSVEMQFVLVLIAFALSLTLGVEVVVIQGDIGRQNTLFKFYMQAWVLFSVACGAGFAWLVQHSDFWGVKQRIGFYGPMVLLFAVAAMFPILSTRARSLDRFAAAETPITLDGLEYMKYTEHVLGDVGVPIILVDDYNIIRWLQENVEGSPVIMEGRSAASEYRYNGRISINTGLPTVLGWNWHQRQQRTLDSLPSMVFQRENNVNFFYETTDIFATAKLIHHYDIRYIINGDMEQALYRPEGLVKFERMIDLGLLSLAYQSGQGKVYAVDVDAIEHFMIYHNGFYDAIALIPEDLPSAGSSLPPDPNHNADLNIDIEMALEVLQQYDGLVELFVDQVGDVQTFQPRAYARLMKLESLGILERHVDELSRRIYRVNREALSDMADGE